MQSALAAYAAKRNAGLPALVFDLSRATVVAPATSGRPEKKAVAMLDVNRFHGVILTNTLPEDDRFLAQIRLPYRVFILGHRVAGYDCVLEAPKCVGQSPQNYTLQPVVADLL